MVVPETVATGGTRIVVVDMMVAVVGTTAEWTTTMVEGGTVLEVEVEVEREVEDEVVGVAVTVQHPAEVLDLGFLTTTGGCLPKHMNFALRP